MDELDISILNLLQKNARITIPDISGRVNLPVSAVSERLKRLESSGIIVQYTAILNPELLQKRLTAIMFVRIERPRYNEKFNELVLGEDEILECNYLAGDFDYALKIVTESTVTLEKLLYRVKSLQGVQKTKTVVVLSNIKNSFSVKPGA